MRDRRQRKYQNFNQFPRLPEIVRNQDTLNNTHNDSTSKTNVARQTPPPKGTQPQNHVIATEQPSGNQTGNELVPFTDCSKKSSSDIQNTQQHVVTLMET